METVEVVIKVPKDLYEGIWCRNGELETEYVCDELMKAVDNGTVLKKRHGRLIDADKIIYYRCPDNVLDCPQSYDFTCQHCDFGITTKFRTDAIPAIIEADKEVKE